MNRQSGRPWTASGVRRSLTRLGTGLVATILLIAPLAFASAAAADTGLGGSTDFQPGSTFPFLAGQTGRVATSMLVQNIGSKPARVTLSSSAPTGITISPLIKTPFMIAPSRAIKVPFAIRTSSSLAAGSYPIIVSLGQTNVPKPKGGGSAYAPAITGSFVVKVVGASGSVTVNAVSGDDKKPITGTLTLAYLDGPDTVVTLQTVTGSTLTRAVVPGRYRAQLEMPGLSRTSRDFSIAIGQKTTITLSVKGVQFLAAFAKPNVIAGHIDSADLIASVRSTIRRLPGPVRFNVTVAHEGRVVEHLKIAELPELSTGTTDQRTSYRPKGGFTAGRWTFVFSVSTAVFTVNADNTPEFTVPGSTQAAGFPTVTTLLVALVAMAAGWLGWFVIAGRRRRKRDEQPPGRTPGGKRTKV